MAVPKKRTSQSKSKMRRSHSALAVTNLVACPNCQELIHPHRVCSSCGQYNGKQVLTVTSE